MKKHPTPADHPAEEPTDEQQPSHDGVAALYEEKIADLKEQIEQEKRARARLAADYANLERRVKEERSRIMEEVSTELLKKLFPMFDNFYRASQHAPSIDVDTNFSELGEDDFKKIYQYFSGLRQIEKQMEDVLHEAGLRRIATRGEVFDPSLHEAISHEENPTVPADTIIDEIEAGWLIHNKVVKPAKVRVSKG